MGIRLKAEIPLVSDNKNLLETHSTLIQQNANQIILKANQTTVDTLAGRVTNAEASITVVAGQIALKANQTTVDGINTRLNTAEQLITPSAITQTVRSSSEYTNDLGAKVGTNEVISRINQTAEAIKIQAGKISLEGLVTVNSRFRILADGSMEATNGVFSGNITANTGSIGRFAISGQDLVYTSELFDYPYDKTDVVRLRRILAGIISATSYDLWVYDTNSSGTLTTTDLIQINNFVESGTVLPTPRKRIRSVVRIGTNNGALTTQAVTENGAVGEATTMRGSKITTSLINANSLNVASIEVAQISIGGTVYNVTRDSNGFLKAT